MKFSKKQIKNRLLEGIATKQAFKLADEFTSTIHHKEVAQKAIELAAQEAIDSGYTVWPDPTDYIEQAKKELMQLQPTMPGPQSHPDHPHMTMPLEESKLTKSSIKKMLMEKEEKKALDIMGQLRGTLPGLFKQDPGMLKQDPKKQKKRSLADILGKHGKEKEKAIATPKVSKTKQPINFGKLQHQTFDAIEKHSDGWLAPENNPNFKSDIQKFFRDAFHQAPGVLPSSKDLKAVIQKHMPSGYESDVDEVIGMLIQTDVVK